jgi:4a-hydroxytetrahydrobiopterin dehydratase
MSEQGWHNFLDAEGVDDWVVLHGGAAAVFRVASLSEAARLAEAVAKAPGIAGAGVLLTLADASVTVWRAVLGYTPVAKDNAVDPLGHGSTVWMQELDQAKPLSHAMHIDVSVAREQVKARLEAAVAAGGRIVDESHAPSHWTLADRAGNRVCICAWPDGSSIDR